LPTFKVAIVGAGPAGYFTAQALQNSQTDDLSFQIDMMGAIPNWKWGVSNRQLNNAETVISWMTENNKYPYSKSENANERNVANLLSTARTLYYQNKLDDNVCKIYLKYDQNIFNRGQVRTSKSIEKGEELIKYYNIFGKIPTPYSGSDNDKKLAVYYNNRKSMKRGGRPIPEEHILSVLPDWPK
jgi:hypothetical protein